MRASFPRSPRENIFGFPLVLLRGAVMSTFREKVQGRTQQTVAQMIRRRAHEGQEQEQTANSRRSYVGPSHALFRLRLDQAACGWRLFDLPLGSRRSNPVSLALRIPLKALSLL